MQSKVKNMDEAFQIELREMRAQAELARKEKEEALRQKHQVEEEYRRKNRLLQKEIELFDDFNRKNVFHKDEADFKIQSMNEMSHLGQPPKAQPESYGYSIGEGQFATRNNRMFGQRFGMESNRRLKSKTEFIGNLENNIPSNPQKHSLERGSSWQTQPASPRHVYSRHKHRSSQRPRNYRSSGAKGKSILKKLNQNKQVFTNPAKRALKMDNYMRLQSRGQSQQSRKYSPVKNKRKHGSGSLQNLNFDKDSLQSFMHNFNHLPNPTFGNMSKVTQEAGKFGFQGDLKNRKVQGFPLKENLNDWTRNRVDFMNGPSREKKFGGNFISPVDSDQNGFSISKQDFEDDSLKKLMEKYAGRF